MLLSSVPIVFATDLTGTWNLVFETEGGPRHTQWDITQNGTELTVNQDGQIMKGTIENDRITLEGKFYASGAGYSATVRLKGSLEGKEIKGKGDWDQYPLAFTGRRAE